MRFFSSATFVAALPFVTSVVHVGRRKLSSYQLNRDFIVLSSKDIVTNSRGSVGS
jgi:hypothetical protein